MKRFLCLMAFAALVAVFPVSGVEIVPKPVSMTETGGTVTIPHTVAFHAADEQLNSLVATWGEMYAPIAGAASVSKSKKADVELALDPALEEEEYALLIADGKVTVSGGTSKAVWWGLQTFAQILFQSASGDCFEVPCLTVSDKPWFSYRAGMLDCCRHFFTLDQVKEYIDILSMHKLNVFHWPLTNDQGWRIEIKKYPRLTEVGAWRKETLVGLRRDPKGYDGTPHGGFYTQDEIRDLVAYAAARGVTVIPEVEMPGHAIAALASYPELGCVGEGYEVATGWGVMDEIFCAGNPKVLEFLKDVFDEVCELFPSEYIHVGGDEAPTTRWEQCPKCQAKMKELGLDDVKYLHGYLLKNIEEYLNAKGRKIIGWDEVLDAGVTPTATVMSWRGAVGGKRAAAQGNDVIMSPNTCLYLDYYQTQDPEGNGEPLGIGGYNPLSKVYAFDPYEDLDEEASAHIIGIQGQVWTEYIATFDHVLQMLLPRCSAVAEDAWGSEKEDFSSFRQRVIDVMVPLYETLGYNYARYGFE